MWYFILFGCLFGFCFVYFDIGWHAKYIRGGVRSVHVWDTRTGISPNETCFGQSCGCVPFCLHLPFYLFAAQLRDISLFKNIKWACDICRFDSPPMPTDPGVFIFSYLKPPKRQNHVSYLCTAKPCGFQDCRALFRTKRSTWRSCWGSFLLSSLPQNANTKVHLCVSLCVGNILGWIGATDCPLLPIREPSLSKMLLHPISRDNQVRLNLPGNCLCLSSNCNGLISGLRNCCSVGLVAGCSAFSAGPNKLDQPCMQVLIIACFVFGTHS